MLIIGLVGQMGSGKSTVAGLLASRGAAWIDVDRVAQRLLWKNGSCYGRVVRTFGRGILSRGRIDRQKLGSIVFGEKRQLNKLERLVHPALKHEVKRLIERVKQQRTVPAIVLDAALLFTLGFNQLTDIVILVKAKKSLCLKRAMKRFPFHRDEILRRMEVLENRINIREADRIINNNGSFKNTKAQVDAFWRAFVSHK